ncbi:AraC family transcriptional regulator [Candidatus Accumulibacter phosphatis]|jgi:AraC-like DNA-binding protein|uniref:AraC family transcriptional regulator n=1 Tax=Candidatus Accumulibacter phosphatis TaxID=327160 RepID=A0ABX1U1K1_9PROT|nr:AraC family transcriptional regulator [Candidatus Accumulibacter phosphatis]NMQ29555.1 AraC family transcriptional regulator [Candidatus Accumulibacter phosphatis]
MTKESTLASSWLILFRLLEAHGVEAHTWLRELGMDPELARQPGARIPSWVVDVVIARAAAVIDDPAFGLAAAECWHPSNLGVLGYAWLSSSTLRQGLQRMQRYARIIGDRWGCRCVDETNGLRFVYDHNRSDLVVGHVMSDYSLALIVAMCRSNFARKLNPVRIFLRRPAPADPRPYQDFYACDVHFGADEDAFVLATADAEMPLRTANRELAAAFDAILAEQLAAHSKEDFISRCQVFLLKQLTSGEPRVDDLVNTLSMSRRTLQRKLREQGTSYHELLEETRYELAKNYLQESTKSVTEITFLLGFSEQGAFTRAFKRWSGAAPRDYRTALAS